jgi:hypothetical protein
MTWRKTTSPLTPIKQVRFINIIIVGNNRGTEYHYLTKAGDVVSNVEPYYDRMTAWDCEQEEFIRFNEGFDYAGLLDKDGKIVIKPKYLALSPVQNGMLEAVQGGEFVKYNSDNNYDIIVQQFHSYRWKGSQHLLLDTSGKVLVKNFKHRESLDFRSLLIDKKPNMDPVRESFKATDGSYYSFINHEKEFLQWFNDVVKSDLSKEALLGYLYDSVTIEDSRPTQSVTPYILDKKFFVDRYYGILLLALEELPRIEIQKLMEPSPYRGFDFANEFQRDVNFCTRYGQGKFCNLCGQHDHRAYPVMQLFVRVWGDIDSFFYRDYTLRFMRTDAGYRLFKVELRTIDWAFYCRHTQEEFCILWRQREETSKQEASKQPNVSTSE